MLQREFSNEMALIRKEYEQVEDILTERNNKLESLIVNLQNKLDQYAGEITYLKNQLLELEKTKQPSESTIEVLRDKVAENEYLKATIMRLNNQISNMKEQETNLNKDLENEIKKVIEDKKTAINTLNNMINNITNDPYENVLEQDFDEVENNGQLLLSDLTAVKEKLDKFFLKLKQTAHPSESEGQLNKDNLIADLQQLKKQCQDEIDILNNAISGCSSSSNGILRGEDRVKKDDTHPGGHTKKGINTPEDLVVTPSNIQLMEHPKLLYPQLESITKDWDLDSKKLYPQERVIFQPQSSVLPVLTCEACRVNWPQFNQDTPQIENKSTLLEDLSSTKEIKITPEKPLLPEAPQKHKKKENDSVGCCSRKKSETSNAPYSVKKRDSPPYRQMYHDLESSSRSKSHSPPHRNKIYRNK